MFRRILVPLDGSAQAEQAIAPAERLARQLDGAVVLVRVIRPLVEYQAARPMPGAWLPAADNEARDEASAYLAEQRSKAQLRDVTTEARVLVGPAAHMILAAAQAERADAIVMTSSGRRGLSRLVLGSVASAVVRDATVPVLVLRGTAALTGSDAEAGHALAALVALDGSPLAEAALAPATQLVAALSWPFTGSVHLLRVVEPSPGRGADHSLIAARERAERRRAVRRERRDARDYLDAMASQARERYADALGVSVTWSIARGRDVAEAILSAAQPSNDATNAKGPHDVDLIALGTHGRGGLARWLMGSVADKVLREAAVPVLVVRPGERAVEGERQPAASELVAAPRAPR